MTGRPDRSDYNVNLDKDEALDKWLAGKEITKAREALKKFHLAVIAANQNIPGLVDIDTGMLDKFYAALAGAESSVEDKKRKDEA